MSRPDYDRHSLANALQELVNCIDRGWLLLADIDRRTPCDLATRLDEIEALDTYRSPDASRELSRFVDDLRGESDKSRAA